MPSTSHCIARLICLAAVLSLMACASERRIVGLNDMGLRAREAVRCQAKDSASRGAQGEAGDHVACGATQHGPDQL